MELTTLKDLIKCPDCTADDDLKCVDFLSLRNEAIKLIKEPDDNFEFWNKFVVGEDCYHYCVLSIKEMFKHFFNIKEEELQ